MLLDATLHQEAVDAHGLAHEQRPAVALAVAPLAPVGLHAAAHLLDHPAQRADLVLDVMAGHRAAVATTGHVGLGIAADGGACRTIGDAVLRRGPFEGGGAFR